MSVSEFFFIMSRYFETCTVAKDKRGRSLKGRGGTDGLDGSPYGRWALEKAGRSPLGIFMLFLWQLFSLATGFLFSFVNQGNPYQCCEGQE